MGSCTSTVNTQKSPVKDHFKTITQGVLKFNVELFNLKLSYPVRSCSLKILIGQSSHFDTPVHIDLDGKHNWVRKIETQVDSTELELQDTYLTISVIEDKNQLALLKISLYDVVSGPTHFDYAIGKGRIQFDMTMSQIIQMEIQVKNLDIIFDECIQDKAYSFSLRLVTRRLFFSTENSEKIQNPAYLKGHSASLGNMFEAMHRLQWDCEEDAPRLILEIPLDELYSSSLQVCIWSVNKVDDLSSPLKQVKDKSTLQKEILDQEMRGETYVGLMQLLEGEEDSFSTYKVYRPSVEKGLWLKGKKIGQLSSKLEAKLPLYLKQQLVGLRTEKGCALGTSILVNSSVKELNEIIEKFEKLSQLIFKLQNQSIDAHQKGQLTLEAQIQAEQLLQVLSKSHKDIGPRQFYYKSSDDLMKAQDTFINIAEHLVKYVEKLDQSLRDKYYSVLDVVCTRGELRLNQLGYFDQCKQLSKRQLAFKNKICLHYQQFLYSTLNQILKKIDQKAMSNPEKLFIERFLVRAYFRVPEFRKQFLQCLVHENDPKLHEWRETTYGLEDKEDIKRSPSSNDQVSDVFDWQSYFYEYLSSEPNQQQVQLIVDDEWKTKFGKRTLTFCLFMDEFCKYIQSIFQTNFASWHSIPGYKCLLKAILCEIKIREIYNDSIQETICNVASNQSLINVIIMILFNKCRLYSSEEVVTTLDIINNCFKQCSVMPTNIDYLYLLNVIKIILSESEHSMSLATCLNLIYNHFLLFPIEFRKNICDLILVSQPYRLFLHWSKTVRSVFQNLLIYRIFHLHRNNNVQITNEEEFKKEYTIAIKPKKMQSFYESRKEQKQLISDYIYLKYTRFIMNLEQAKFKLKELDLQMRDMTIIERMKMKIQQIRENQRTSIRELVIEDQGPRQIKHFQTLSEKKICLFQRAPADFAHINQGQGRDRTITLTKDQFRYLLIALNEHNELMKVYTKWRQSNISSSQQGGLSPEEKSQKYLEFPVPPIKVMQHFDLKEGKDQY